MKQAADVEYGEAENDEGRMQPCVFASCGASDVLVGPIWGDSEASVKVLLGQQERK